MRTGHDIVTVTRVVEETPTVRTLFFEADLRVKPGQFVMVWVPGVDEIPMSLSYLGREKGITVKNIGDATMALASLKAGDRFGLRGPLGNSFVLEKGKILAVVGGCGMAAVAPAVELAASLGAEVDVCLGAKTRAELLFRDRLLRSAKVHVSTDDGSEGFKGFVTDLAKKVLAEKKFDRVIACGPEPLMRLMLEASRARGVPFQASLERYMKCGIGLCDACAFGPHHVCRNGPVFDGDKLINVEDFGRFRRDPSGRKVRV